MPESPADNRTDTSSAAPATPYRVLARKYRPDTFAGLIGQEALVTTLTNALRAGRVAHAFLLTGVRGVGKTTTARIIARALNCIGPDGTGGPTPEPCGVCENCRAIAEDRHVDVLEMDAASRTGVDDIRELIEGVRYRPTLARTKVYIIDEVHMLSRNAFNALLKTLEEPPEHVKFVFATTETRKVPVTVLSRCQRFDLRRVDQETLAGHLRSIAEQEKVAIAEGTLGLIARAADGSVRDALSLLDQAIAHGGEAIDEAHVRGMLGLADRTAVFDLLDAALRGDIRAALDHQAEQHAAGADPALVVEDLLALVHWLTRITVVPETADEPGIPEAERVRGRDMATRLPVAELSRAWQILLKGLAEVRGAPDPHQALEMLLIRFAYTARLPTPAEALKASPGGPAKPAPAAPVPAATPAAAPYAQSIQRDAPPAAAPSGAGPASFQAVVDLAGERGELMLTGHLVNDVHLVRFEPGRIELGAGAHAPADLARRLARFLEAETGHDWSVVLSEALGAPTLREQGEAADADRRAEAARHPFVQAVMETFPGAKLAEVRPIHVPDASADTEKEDPADDSVNGDQVNGDRGDNHHRPPDFSDPI